MRDLQRLILDRLSELELSFRDAARRSNGLVSHATLNNITTGRHSGKLTDQTFRGIALAVDLPLSTVADAAGVTLRREGTIFRLPERASRLTPRQRRAVLQMVDALLDDTI